MACFFCIQYSLVDRMEHPDTQTLVERAHLAGKSVARQMHNIQQRIAQCSCIRCRLMPLPHTADLQHLGYLKVPSNHPLGIQKPVVKDP
jgi:hypothetical protein